MGPSFGTRAYIKVKFFQVKRFLHHYLFFLHFYDKSSLVWELLGEPAILITIFAGHVFAEAFIPFGEVKFLLAGFVFGSEVAFVVENFLRRRC